MNARKLSLIVGMAALVPAGSARAEPALRILSWALSRSYFAERLSDTCVGADTTFATKATGSLGGAREYAQDIAGEVLDGLSPEQQQMVITQARRAADLVFRNAAHGIESLPYPGEARKLERWCNVYAVPVVRDMMEWHDRDHDQFLRALAAAKHP